MRSLASRPTGTPANRVERTLTYKPRLSRYLQADDKSEAIHMSVLSPNHLLWAGTVAPPRRTISANIGISAAGRREQSARSGGAGHVGKRCATFRRSNRAAGEWIRTALEDNHEPERIRMVADQRPGEESPRLSV
jgi:hypothetical protein